MPTFSRKVCFEVTVLFDTGQALLCYFNELDTEEWIPQSQIDDDSEVYEAGDEGIITISEWIAIQRHLL